jgi:ribosomal protein S18 acetylase RimI-like enzyme
MSTASNASQPQPIRGLGHWRAVRQMLRDYAPGVDTEMDFFRTLPFPLGVVARNVGAPIYFALEQGWMLPGPHGEMTAIMYTRAEQRDGVGVVHVDDINVDARSRVQGLASRLLAFADELARRKRYRYVKLAVTVTNTPAVTLYRRLGYRDQHHHFYRAEAAALAAHVAPASQSLHMQPLARAAAAEQARRFFQMERAVDTPDTAPVMAAFYEPRVPRGALWAEAIAHDDRDVGCWFAWRARHGSTVMLGLRPELWGGEVERDVLRVLAERARRLRGGQIRLWLMSEGHHHAVSAGAASLAAAFDLVEATDERMIMVKLLPSGSA